MKTTLQDSELGMIELRRHTRSRSIRIKLRPDGTTFVTMPTYTPLFMVKRFLDKSRPELMSARQQQQQQKTANRYYDQQKIGTSHKIICVRADVDKPKAYVVGQIVRWIVPDSIDPSDPAAQKVVATAVHSALDKQARAYLPRQLRHLANKHGFSFEKLRFGNAKGRWGSCSSSGTISLNIALMALPEELIDYVLLHELCHTKELNHSKRFWELVAACSPDYRSHRLALKKYSPYL